MADNKRPLIFIPPLSESLIKLKEVCEQTAEQDGIEIFEVEKIQELAQLMGQMGPSLMIYSNPKKCALALQINRNVIRKLQAKTVLLVQKPIPSKTLDKFMKVGLTDCIVEPIPPKTLLYKIKLLIKALPSIDDGNADYRTITTDMKEKAAKEMQLKEGKAGKGSDQQEQEIHSKKVAGVIGEMADDPKMMQEGESEENIETHYKGKVKTEDDLEDLDDVRKSIEDEVTQNDSYIESFYKGKTGGEGLDVEDDTSKTKNKLEEDLSEDEISMLKQGISLDVEDDLYKKNKKDDGEDVPLQEIARKKKGSTLDVQGEESGHDKGEGQVDHIETHYKSERQTDSLDIEDDQDLLGNKGQADVIEGPIIAKRKPKDELEIEDDLYSFKEKDEELSADEERKKKALAELDIQDDSQASPDSDGKVDHIEKYYKNKKKNAETQLDIENDSNPLKKEKAEEEGPDLDFLNSSSNGLEVEDDSDTKHDEGEHTSESKSQKLKKVNSLDVQEDLYKKKKLKDEESADFSGKKKKNLNPLAVEDNSLYDKELKDDEADASDVDFLKRAQGLDVEDDLNAQMKMTAEEKEEFKKRKKLDALNVDDDMKNGAPRQLRKVDHIEKYYGTKKKQLEDPNWDGLVKKTEKEELQVKEKNFEEKSLIISKEDLGEQTIDYSKIKEEFESMGGGYSSNLKTRYEIQEDGKAKDSAVYTRGPGGELLGPEELSKEGVVDGDEEEDEAATIYAPDSKGLENAIRALYLYEDSEAKPEDIIKYIAKTLNQKWGARTTFFTWDANSSTPNEMFNGHLLFNHFESESESSDGIDTLDAKEQWTNYMLQNISQWKESKLPLWSDETFQAQDIQFIYPYFEGTSSMGLAACDIPGKFNASWAPAVEILLESARSLYLSKYHQSGNAVGKPKNKENKSNKNDEGKKGGLFSKIFSKKAG